MKTCTMVNVQMTGGMPGGFRFPASCLVSERGKKKGFMIQIHSFLNDCCLCKYCLDKWLLVQCICPPTVVNGSQSSCHLHQCWGPLSTYQNPHTLLLSPSQMAFITREILPTGASWAWKCHPEIQGRANLLCALVVWW